jgi:hypothetical protein
MSLKQKSPSYNCLLWYLFLFNQITHCQVCTRIDETYRNPFMQRVICRWIVKCEGGMDRNMTNICLFAVARECVCVCAPLNPPFLFFSCPRFNARKVFLFLSKLHNQCSSYKLKRLTINFIFFSFILKSTL